MSARLGNNLSEGQLENSSDGPVISWTCVVAHGLLGKKNEMVCSTLIECNVTWNQHSNKLHYIFNTDRGARIGASVL